MKRFKIDKHGFIRGWGDFAEAEEGTVDDVHGVGYSYSPFLFKIGEDGLPIITNIPSAHPSQYHVWSDTLGNWVDNTPLEVLKAHTKSHLNKLRDEAEIAPISVDGNLFDVDSKSLQRMDLAIKAALTVPWTLADNSSILVNSEMLTKVLSELAIRGLQLHNKCKMLKLAVESAITPEEVKSVKWD